MRRASPARAALLACLLAGQALGAGADIVVASKNFPESNLLAEIMAQTLEAAGHTVERRFSLGGTLICYEALRNGEIDVYPEYTGTLSQVILKLPAEPGFESLRELVSREALEILPSFGFNNTYALAMKEELAASQAIARISDLARHELTMAYSLEFLNREDGWPGLAATYGFDQIPTGIEHGLAYQAIDEGKIDITDAYSTDGDLARYRLTVLEDDLGYFPKYLALPFVRADMAPEAKELLAGLAGRIDDRRMRDLNAEIVVHGKGFPETAQAFLAGENLRTTTLDDNQMWRTLVNNTLIHIKLTAIALALGCAIGLPIGIAVFRSPPTARAVVYFAGLMQTIPSLALLAFMIPLFGIGEVPAIIALFLYSLLPILRNTITALTTIDPLLKRIAAAIGLTRLQQLRYVLVPLALPNILAGIKTATIISIGTATLAAFIGAGGLGEPIITGLSLNDTGLILQGAIPAACLAILAELLFELLERILVREHLRVGQMPS